MRLVSFSPLDLRTLAKKADFNPELGARLGELTLKLPPVREFAEDVPDLASLMLAQLVEPAALFALPVTIFAPAGVRPRRGRPGPPLAI